MSKNYFKKRRLKYVFLAAACTASFSLTGLVAACTPENPDEEETKPVREDTQLLKNGDFEFFDVPEKEEDGNAPVYLINTPNNWTTGGTSSYTKSGIIGTSEKAWETISDKGLAGKLDYNNELDSSASDYKANYIDYNGMTSTDILYKDTWAALNEGSIDDWTSYFNIETKDGKYYFDGIEVYRNTEGESGDEKDIYYFDTDFEQPVSKAQISNPETHYNVQKDGNGLYYMDGSERVTVYEDKDGDYYLNYDEAKDEYNNGISHVLMLHNYATTHNGIAQNYASISIDLPANTAAEVSLWVKTSDLFYDQGKNVMQDRGANISVTHTVGSTTLNDFVISCINTQKLINESKASDDYNGWVKYTVYVNSCDFTSSTVTLKLGLGETGKTVEGYAFFDDVTVTKYVDIESDGCTYDEGLVGNAVWTLSDDESEKVFEADSWERNGGNITDERYSNNFYYLLDLASENKYKQVVFGADNEIIKNLKAGLTIDSDNYVSSKDISGINLVGFGSAEQPAASDKLPDSLKNMKVNGQVVGLDTSEDLLAYVRAGYTFSNIKYSDNLNTALEGADKLPKTDNFGTGDNSVLVMLSAKGAAYTSSFELSVNENSYQIISFWVKTSDMDGNSAATIRLTDADDKDNTVNVALDTTDIVTDIDDDNKDIYNGWVQCFFFVHNDTDGAKQLKVEFCFGNTTINGTTVTSYKAGWVALANMQTLEVSEDIYGYTGGGDYTATMTLTKTDEKKTGVFDEVRGSEMHDIEQGLVTPSSYTGYNGASSPVKNNDIVSLPYDEANSNVTNGVNNAGLLNRDYAENYEKYDWYKNFLVSHGVNPEDVNYSDTQALENWNKVFGEKSVQPLIIINRLRDTFVQVMDATEDNFTAYYIKNEDGDFVKVNELDDPKFDENETYYNIQQVLNYGFIGSTKSVSADSFTTVSVKVKVSKGAVAYIYLVEGKDVLSFTAPSYSFYYDVDGNVLKSEPDDSWSLTQQRENILYSLRPDGLYEDSEGNLFANLYNYIKVYKDEQADYFNEFGIRVIFDELKEGETYWISSEAANDKDATKQANHFLTSTDGTKLYEYIDGKYYYIVDGQTQSDLVVNAFDTDYARYDYSELSEEYKFVLDARYDENGKFMTDDGAGEAGYDKDGNLVADKWFTVNFVIHAGSASKSYRLELWSGERESALTSGDKTSGAEGSSVIFDYSYASISDDTLMTEYETEIIRAYQTLLASKGLLKDIATSQENISYYESLVNEYIENGTIKTTELTGVLNNYKAHYYTFSLYDSADFVPFNENTADENATGYDYSVDDYAEALAFLQVKDNDVYTIFADYSTVDKSISIGTDDGDDTDEDEDTTDDGSSVWLLASSIILVIALLFAMMAIFVKDALKKARRNKVLGNNKYNHNKANRYMRKLGLKKEEFEEVPSDGAEAEVDTTVDAEEITEQNVQPSDDVDEE